MGRGTSATVTHCAQGEGPQPSSFLGFGCWAGVRGSVFLPPRPGEDKGTQERDHVPGRRRPLAEHPGHQQLQPSTRVLLCSQEPEPHQILPFARPEENSPCVGAEFAQKVSPRDGQGLLRPGRQTKHTHACRGGSLNILLFLTFKMANNKKNNGVALRRPPERYCHEESRSAGCFAGPCVGCPGGWGALGSLAAFLACDEKNIALWGCAPLAFLFSKGNKNNRVTVENLSPPL